MTAKIGFLLILAVISTVSALRCFEGTVALDSNDQTSKKVFKFYLQILIFKKCVYFPYAKLCFFFAAENTVPGLTATNFCLINANEEYEFQKAVKLSFNLIFN